MDDDYEQVLLVKPDVFIYRIPPKAAGRAYRASDWKLDAPDWTGRLRLVVKGNQCSLNIEDKQTGKLFAKCFIDQYPGNAIESVADSSRYFVIKIKNETDGRTAAIGMGFTDRSDSFDLNVAIQDHFKRIHQQEQIEKGFHDEDSSNPKLDLSLKEGQTIKVNLNIGKSSSNRARPKATGVTLNPGILPPPPSAVKIAPPPSVSPVNQFTSTTTTSEERELVADDIWSSKESQPTSLSSAATVKPDSANLLLQFDDLTLKSKTNTSAEDNDEEKWGDFASHSDTKTSSWENF